MSHSPSASTKSKLQTENSETSVQAAEIIESVLPEELKSLTEEQKQIVVGSIIAAKSESFSGPLPHPQILQKYNEILPGSAERILKMAENEQEHRIEYDNSVLKGMLSQTTRGQWMGFGLCSLFGVLSLGMAYLGYPVVAGILGGSTIVALAIVFVLHRDPKHTEKNTKD